METIYKDVNGVVVVLSYVEYEKVSDFLSEAPKEEEVFALDYHHVGQNAPGAYENKNDCGSACVAIIAHHNGFRATVDDISEKFQRPNKPMFIHEVRVALGHFQIANAYSDQLSSELIENHIRTKNKPVVALVHYGSLPHKAIPNYVGSHYIVLYGVTSNNNFLYHDPLSDGRLLLISSKGLVQALNDVKADGNRPNQGILIL